MMTDHVVNLRSEVIRLKCLITGQKQIIRELIESSQGLLTAFELEADYPGERSREEVSNTKALIKELIDSGYG